MTIRVGFFLFASDKYYLEETEGQNTVGYDCWSYQRKCGNTKENTFFRTSTLAKHRKSDSATPEKITQLL